MSYLFEKIPIRDNYKDTRDQAIKLKGPVNLVRSCFLFEVAAFCAAFAVSYYLTSISTTTETLITFEVLGGEYSCQVLSPKSTGEFLSTVSSEAVQYSSMRYTYDECMKTLDTENLNVCSHQNRNDFTVSISGIAANDDGNCFDVLLVDNYRFCYANEEESVLLSDALTQFPIQKAPSRIYQNVFFFTNQSGIIHTVSVPFASNDIKVSFISDRMYNVYCIASNTAEGQDYLYELSAHKSTATVIKKVTYGTYYGLTVGTNGVNNILYSYSITGVTGMIYAYNVVTGGYSTLSIDCSDIRSDKTQYISTTTYRYVSYDYSTDLLYVMCSSDVTISTQVMVPGQPPVTVIYPEFSFFQVNFAAGSTNKITSRISSLNYTDSSGEDTGQGVNSIEQVVAVNNVAFAYTGGTQANIIAIDLSPQPTIAPTLAPTEQPTRPATPAPSQGGSPSGSQAGSPGSSPGGNPLSPTFAPSIAATSAPTTLQSVVNMFSVNQNLMGVSAATYKNNYLANNNIFKNTIIALIKGLLTSDITVTDVTDSNNISGQNKHKAATLNSINSNQDRNTHNKNNNNMHSDNHIHYQAIDECIVSYSIQFNVLQLQEYNTNDSSRAYKNITNTLNTALSTGEFDDTLHSYATAANSADLSNTTSTSIETSPLVLVTVTPTNIPTAVPFIASQMPTNPKPTALPINSGGSNTAMPSVSGSSGGSNSGASGETQTPTQQTTPTSTQSGTQSGGSPSQSPSQLSPQLSSQPSQQQQPSQSQPSEGPHPSPPTTQSTSAPQPSQTTSSTTAPTTPGSQQQGTTPSQVPTSSGDTQSPSTVGQPTAQQSPSAAPSNVKPTAQKPTAVPSTISQATDVPTSINSANPTENSNSGGSTEPSQAPSPTQPGDSIAPSGVQGAQPSMQPSSTGSDSLQPTQTGSNPAPTQTVTAQPSNAQGSTQMPAPLKPTAVPSSSGNSPAKPTALPSGQSSESPSAAQTVTPSNQAPSEAPSTIHPTSGTPSKTPTISPTFGPTGEPSLEPSRTPTTMEPSVEPTMEPSNIPSTEPTLKPSFVPSFNPTVAPSLAPSTQAPSNDGDTIAPTPLPSDSPSVEPSESPTSCTPSLVPSSVPTQLPSISPTVEPSEVPSTVPSLQPTTAPSYVPNIVPSMLPTTEPSMQPSTDAPTAEPSFEPSIRVTTKHSPDTSKTPTAASNADSPPPSNPPNNAPAVEPSETPSTQPSSWSIAPTMGGTPASSPPSTQAGTPSGTTSGTQKPKPVLRLAEAEINHSIGITNTDELSEGLDIQEIDRYDELSVALSRRRLRENPVYQPAQVIAKVSKDNYLLPGFGTTLYIGNSDSCYINATADNAITNIYVVEQYLDFRSDFYTATTVQLGYSYSICNENNTFYTINPSYLTDFYSQCGEKNGVYYQNNRYITIPDTCAGLMDSTTSDISQLLNCPAIKALVSNFTTDDCLASFDTICTKAYTDNPPFSCNRDVSLGFLALFASSFSNASFVATVVIILIHFSLKRIYPQGINYTRVVTVETGEKVSIALDDLQKIEKKKSKTSKNNSNKVSKVVQMSSVVNNFSNGSGGGSDNKNKSNNGNNNDTIQSTSNSPNKSNKSDKYKPAAVVPFEIFSTNDDLEEIINEHEYHETDDFNNHNEVENEEESNKANDVVGSDNKQNRNNSQNHANKSKPAPKNSIYNKNKSLGFFGRLKYITGGGAKNKRKKENNSSSNSNSSNSNNNNLASSATRTQPVQTQSPAVTSTPVDRTDNLVSENKQPTANATQTPSSEAPQLAPLLTSSSPVVSLKMQPPLVKIPSAVLNINNNSNNVVLNSGRKSIKNDKDNNNSKNNNESPPPQTNMPSEADDVVSFEYSHVVSDQLSNLTEDSRKYDTFSSQLSHKSSGYSFLNPTSPTNNGNSNNNNNIDGNDSRKNSASSGAVDSAKQNKHSFNTSVDSLVDDSVGEFGDNNDKKPHSVEKNIPDDNNKSRNNSNSNNNNVVSPNRQRLPSLGNRTVDSAKGSTSGRILSSKQELQLARSLLRDL